jgi:hypothetical protein
MKVNIDKPKLARFSIISIAFVVLSISAAVVTNLFGIGFSVAEVFENLHIVIILCLVWILLIAFTRGWIRRIG